MSIFYPGEMHYNGMARTPIDRRYRALRIWIYYRTAAFSIDRKGTEDEDEEGESDQEHHRDPLPAQVPADERQELFLLPVTGQPQLGGLPQEDRRGVVLQRAAAAAAAVGQLLQRSITPGADAE